MTIRLQFSSIYNGVKCPICVGTGRFMPSGGSKQTDVMDCPRCAPPMCRQCGSPEGSCATVGDPCPWQSDPRLPVATVAT